MSTNEGQRSRLRGQLAVATPSLADPNFAHAVVLILDHDDDGSLGVVLNRPSDVEIGAILPAWQPFAASPERVFVGGPVQPEGVLALADGHGPESEFAIIRDGVAVLDLDAEPDDVTVHRLRIFAGYAGWGPGQLATEIARGDWFVVDARADDVFSALPADLWQDVLHRQGGAFRTISPDPTLN